MPKWYVHGHRPICTYKKLLYLNIISFKMTRQLIIEHTIKAINQLPDDKAQEISDFADFIIKRYDEQILNEGIQELLSKGQTYEFLNDEEDLYSVADLKEVYNG
jgi:hypothetical protein